MHCIHSRPNLNYVIRSTKTRAYFYEGRWTFEAAQAEVFADSRKALTACLENQLRDVELVLQFGAESGRTHNIPLPVADQLLCL